MLGTAELRRPAAAIKRIKGNDPPAYDRITARRKRAVGIGRGAWRTRSGDCDGARLTTGRRCTGSTILGRNAVEQSFRQIRHRTVSIAVVCTRVQCKPTLRSRSGHVTTSSSQRLFRLLTCDRSNSDVYHTDYPPTAARRWFPGNAPILPLLSLRGLPAPSSGKRLGRPPIKGG
jgi:hypothetical protein